MNPDEKLRNLKDRAHKNLTEVIMPFWTGEFLLDKENGGFYGRVTKDMEIIKDEPRALVLNGRMAYAFSKAYTVLGKKIYLDRAKRACEYILEYFYDSKYGGAFNSVSHKGEVLDDKKLTYAEAFFVIAAAGYAQASGGSEARRVGMEMFDIMESRYKTGKAAYVMGLTRDFSAPTIMEMGGKRFSFPKNAVMFQHHLLQAYEQLYRATGEEKVKSVLKEFAEYILGSLFDPVNDCLKGMLDENGSRMGPHQSFGHDCEISYLAMDVAELIGDEGLISKTKDVCIKVLNRVLEKDIDEYGSLINGGDLESGEMDKTRVWWAQAEGVSAMLCGYQLTGNLAFLDACDKILAYIEKYFVNREYGDWYNNVLVDKTGYHIVDGMHGFDKVNGGKCPFHNSNMCFQVIKRTDEILKNGVKK